MPEFRKLDFSTFVLSISTSAMTYLGLMENPEDGSTTVNLPVARQNIDILELLEAKTVGNLSADEEKLLGTLLYDLRLKFVEVCRKNQ